MTMGDRVIAVDVYGWHNIPWNKNCDECVHFVAAPPAQQAQQPLLYAVWTHMVKVHGIEMHGNPGLAKEIR